MTAILTKGLTFFFEADSIGGADGSNVVEWNNQVPGGPALAANAPYPTLKTNALTGKNSNGDSVARKSVVWNGSANPLKTTTALNVRHGFIVAKITSSPAFGNFAGLLTAPTDNLVLVGNENTGNFYDFRNKWFEYRLNGRGSSRQRVWVNGGYTETLSAPASIGSYGLIYFKFWDNLQMNGVQIGQDRNLANRLLSGEVALAALYEKDLLEPEVRANMRSIAFSYQIPLAESFPFTGSKGDTRTPEKKIISDGQDEPNTRVRRGLRNSIEGNFSLRSMDELKQVEAFYNANYPDKTFLFRDLNVVPARDYLVRFRVPSSPNFGENANLSSYSLNFEESRTEPAYSIPADAATIG